MVDIYQKYPDTNWGFMFLDWLNGIKTPKNSMGNGAAMRISAAGWYGRDEEEVKELCSRSQTAILNNEEKSRGYNMKYLPYVFTEHGVMMLSGLLKSEVAARVNVSIINAFHSAGSINGFGPFGSSIIF